MASKAYPFTPVPTYNGFVEWVRGVMGVSAIYLPDGSLSFEYAYNTAVGTVLPNLQCVPGPFYLQAVYNLGGHMLAMWAPDVPGLVYKTVDGVDYGFFAYLRKTNNMLGYTTGTVTGSSDEGTSVQLVVPEQAQNLTIGQLGLTTTPWGRAYLGIAQSYGTNWGIS